MTTQTSKSRAGSESTAANATEVTREDASADGEEPSSEISRDLVFDALKNSRRRLVLRYLHEQTESVTLNDLVEHVAAHENDATPSDLTSEQRKRVYVGLYQSHLPRLDDMGFVEFDPGAGDVDLEPAGEAIERHLFVDGDDRHRFRGDAEFVAVATVVLAIGLAAGLVDVLGAITLFAGIAVGVVALAVYRRVAPDDE